jgi:hypothetical protein
VLFVEGVVVSALSAVDKSWCRFFVEIFNKVMIVFCSEVLLLIFCWV